MFQSEPTLTFANAKRVLEGGLAAIAGGQTEMNLSNLQTVDSSAVASLLAWHRAGAEKGNAINFRNMPPNLKSLMDLYGVDALLHR